MPVLVVDDSPSGRLLIADILAIIHLPILEAATGQQALDLARSHLPDLILLDIDLPGLSGLEVCQQLKADSRTAHIPVLMLTGFTRDHDHAEGLRCGAADYLCKPFSPRDLIERVQILLRADR